MQQQTGDCELQTNLQFTWDERKAVRNMEKHRLGFDEATTIFDDPMVISFMAMSIRWAKNVTSPSASPASVVC
jgi:hypothetical protein